MSGQVLNDPEQAGWGRLELPTPTSAFTRTLFMQQQKFWSKKKRDKMLQTTTEFCKTYNSHNSTFKRKKGEISAQNTTCMTKISLQRAHDSLTTRSNTQKE